MWRSCNARRRHRGELPDRWPHQNRRAKLETFGWPRSITTVPGRGYGVVDGRSNREIADYCKIGEDTVKRHLSNIFDKLGVSSRLELALFAVNQRLPLKSIGGPPDKKIGPTPREQSRLATPVPIPSKPKRDSDPGSNFLQNLLVALVNLYFGIAALAVFAAAGYGAFLVLRVPLRFLARFVLRLTS